MYRWLPELITLWASTHEDPRWSPLDVEFSVHGTLVNVRPTPEPMGDESLPETTRLALAIGKIIQSTFAARELDVRISTMPGMRRKHRKFICR